LAEKIRNVVLVGHSGSGKTTLAESLLFAAGETTRMGRVEDGNTVADFEPEERNRRSSVSLAMAPFAWNGYRINLIDTPGVADFTGEVRAALRAADLALFVVSAVDGVEVQTEQIWKLAEEEGVARALFVNKLDRERASFSRTLQQLKDVFGTPVAPVLVPIGAENTLSGVANLVGGKAYSYPGGAIKATEGELPDGMQGEVATLHTALVEAVVETDDKMLEKYLEGVEPTGDQLIAGMHRGMVQGSAFPVLCGSAVRGIGIDRLAQFIVDFGPSPEERPAPPLAAGAALPEGGVVAYIFKTMSDPYVGRISLFRVYRGVINLDVELENPKRHVNGRMHTVFTMRGKEHHDVKHVVAGDIAAVAKLEATLSGDTLRSPGLDVVITPVPLPNPTMSLAVFPRSQHDEEKLSAAPDPGRRGRSDAAGHAQPVTHETVLSDSATPTWKSPSRLAAHSRSRWTPPLPKIAYRDDPGQGRRGGQAQEAVGRPRPVRRRQHPFRASPHRNWLRVRQRDQGRLHPQAIPAGRGQGRPGGARPGNPGGVPGRRCAGDRVRRQVPRRRLRRVVVPDGRDHGGQGGGTQAERRSPRADHEGPDHHP
jgi:elongation factor G